ncbi:class I SAM-dependent methyltransferase [Saprospiraceae bacterium]|nr:class I SAM-dependent methyltransferase [Saprospiraceae bacterium]
MINEIGNMDIYLLDQLMKGRVAPGMKILDAGCGVGRNSEYFIKNNYNIFGIDINEEAIQNTKEQIVLWNRHFDLKRFFIADLLEIPFPDNEFDFIISSAVLHFAKDRNHFRKLFEELVRVLNPGGILFIRMTTKHTLVHLSQHLYDDVYNIPDGSTRYLLDVDHLRDLMTKNKLSFADPFKTVNVENIRTMAVVVLQKENNGNSPINSN